MAIDYLGAAEACGPVAHRLLQFGGDWNCLRPFMEINPRTGDPTGRTLMTLNVAPRSGAKAKKKNVVVHNAPSTLMKDEYVYFDDVIVEESRPVMRLVNDIVGAGLTMNIADGMAVTVIQHQTMVASGNATWSMDGLRTAQRDRPLFDLVNHPLPIVHGDFSFGLREILQSRRQGIALDTTQLRETTRVIAEDIEKVTLGSIGSYSYGGGTIYGLTNHPDRIAKVLTNPTDPGWTPDVTYNEILDMIQSAQDVRFNGPYWLYFSPAWTKYLNMDYSAAYPGVTLRTKLRDLGVGDDNNVTVKGKLDFLSGYQIILLQPDRRVVRMINGMALKTVQWESHGGMEINFKVLGIIVPQVRSNASGDNGIVHGVAA